MDGGDEITIEPPSPPTSLLLLIFVHGFRGSDQSFSTFPADLCSALSGTLSLSRTAIKSLVYPRYETRGNIYDAVDKFLDWLLEQTLKVQKEFLSQMDENTIVGPKVVDTILLAHSMGGLLIADAATRLKKEESVLSIIGVIAFDTPYYGLHPHLLSRQVEKYTSYAQQGADLLETFGGTSIVTNLWNSNSNSPSSSSSKPKPPATLKPSSANPSTALVKMQPSPSSSSSNLVSYGMLAGAGLAAAGGLWFGRNVIGKGVRDTFAWTQDHLDWLGELWKEDKILARMKDINDIYSDRFHCFYTLLNKKVDGQQRTFIIRPSQKDPLKSNFSPNINPKAVDEIDAHVSIFEPERNDGYYSLDQETKKLILNWCS